MDMRRLIGAISTAGDLALTATFAASKDTHSPSAGHTIGHICGEWIYVCNTLEVLVHEQRGFTNANVSYPERRVIMESTKT
jgi:hypothetical protein